MEHPKVTYESAERDVIYTGVIQPYDMKNNTFTLKIDILEYIFEFIDDENPKADMKFDTEELTGGKKGLKFILKNYRNSLGTTNTSPRLIGWINNHNIFMNYSVYDINGYKSMMITLYRERQPRQKNAEK